MAIRAAPRLVVFAFAIVTAAACGSPGPRPLTFGGQECTQCHMTLADPRFAGQLVTVTGKTIPFDDVGCLATFIVTGGISPDEIHSVWFQDFAGPDSMLNGAEAVFLRQDSVRTPMDHGILALRGGAATDRLRGQLGGELLTWEEVLAWTRARLPR